MDASRQPVAKNKSVLSLSVPKCENKKMNAPLNLISEHNEQEKYICHGYHQLTCIIFKNGRHSGSQTSI